MNTNPRALLFCLFPLLAGCVAVRQPVSDFRAAQSPPLPDAPDIEPSPAPEPSPPKPVFAVWTFDGRMLDVIEASQTLTNWFDLPGPYPLREVDAVMSYYVPVTTYGGRNSYFRIRRVWGVPWTNAPKIELKTETEKIKK